MVKPVEKSPADEQSLKAILHGKIDRMDYTRLSKLSHILDQWRLEELGQTLDDAFDQDREQGKLTEEKVSKAISEHRAQHPYDS